MKFHHLIMESDREPEIWFEKSFKLSPEVLALIELSTKDPFLGDMAKRRLSPTITVFYADNEPIGFAIPRKDSDGHWRTGPIFVKEGWRRKGIAKRFAGEFFKGKKGRAYIEETNHASQKLYESLGFVKTEKFVADGDGVKLYQYLKSA